MPEIKRGDIIKITKRLIAYRPNRGNLFPRGLITRVEKIRNLDEDKPNVYDEAYIVGIDGTLWNFAKYYVAYYMNGPYIDE